MKRTRSTLEICSIVFLLAIAIAAIAAAPRSAAASEWALYEPACDQGTSLFEVPCGDYGTFHFLEISDPPGCTPIAEGDLPLSHYPQPFELPLFPEEPQQKELTLAGKQSADVGGQLNDLYLVGIDFDTSHGTSTSWLSGLVAGTGIEAELELLDGPSAEPLGPEVGDEHVLAALCRLAEGVDVDGRPAPLAVNMSFGRAQDDQDDPSSESCSPELVGCQMAKVITYLRSLGAEFVAAAGNHQQTLFPAALDGVAAAGALDLNWFFEAELSERSWETPPTADAVMPANALCLRGGWAAAAGSSYASAIFAGWTAELRVRRPGLSTLDGELWAPHWWDDRQCYVLMLDGVIRSRCNAGVSDLFAGLLGEYESDCWQSANALVPTVGSPGPPGPLPGHPTFDTWVSENHPTPEADPCVPCVGDPNSFLGESGWTDFLLNMSRSPALPDQVVLDSVYLRVDSAFYPLDLADSTLLDIENGALDGMLFSGWGGVVTTEREASLVYVLKGDADDECNPGGPPGSDPCYWSSTPILWLP